MTRERLRSLRANTAWVAEQPDDRASNVTPAELIELLDAYERSGEASE